MAGQDTEALAVTGSEKYEIDGVTYSVHPGAALLPLLEGPSFVEFVADVKARGILDPVAYQGRVIIDGRTRVRAGLAAGVPVPLVELDAGIDVYAHIASKNVHRRHLKPSQRATVAQGLVSLSKERAREESRLREQKRLAAKNTASRSTGDPESPDATPPVEGAPDTESASSGGAAGGSGASGADAPAPDAPPDVIPPMSTKQAALALGVPPSMVQRAATIVNQAPELERPMADDLITVHDAGNLLPHTPEVRKQALDLVREGKAPTAAQALRMLKLPPVEDLPDAKPNKARPGHAPKPTAPKAAGGGTPALPALPGDEAAAPPAPPDSSAEASPAASTPSPSLPPPSTAGSIPSSTGEGAETPAASGAAAQGSQEQPEAPAQAAVADWPADLLSPEPVVTAVREIYGTIALDPCSSDSAQARVKAKGWYGEDELPLTEDWKQPVYVFPPGKACRQFAQKLRAELDKRLTQAIFVGPFDLSERWVTDFLGHRHFTGVVLSRRLVEFDVPGRRRRWRAPLPLAVYLFGAEASPAQIAKAFDFWGHVLVSVREDVS